MLSVTVAFKVIITVYLAPLVASLCTPIEKTPPPPLTYCGVRVATQSHSGSDANIYNAATFDSCRDVALNHGAAAFQFEADGFESQCILHGPDFNVNRLSLDAGSKAIFSEAACYTCKASCPPPINTELLHNGDFAMSTGFIYGPWHTTGPKPMVVTGREGNVMSVLPQGNQHSSLIQNVQLCKGSLYALKFDYKVDSPEGKRDSLLMSLRAGNSFGVLDPKSPSPWTTFYEHVFASGDDFDSLELLAYPKTASIYLDNFSLQAILPPIPPSNAPYLDIGNGDFESGSLDQWTLTFGKTEIVDGLNGKHALRVPKLAFIHHNFTSKVDHLYKLTMEVDPHVNPKIAEVRVGLSTSHGFNYGPNGHSMGGRSTYVGYFVSRQVSDTLHLYFIGHCTTPDPPFGGCIGDNLITIDDIRIQEVGPVGGHPDKAQQVLDDRQTPML